jgi:hypothetical protein
MPRRSSTVPSAPSASTRSALLPDEGGLRAEPALTRGVACSGCGSDRVTRISMTLTDGTPVDFTSCHVCEHRTWQESAGDTLALDGVLQRTRKTR